MLAFNVSDMSDTFSAASMDDVSAEPHETVENGVVRKLWATTVLGIRIYLFDHSATFDQAVEKGCAFLAECKARAAQTV